MIIVDISFTVKESELAGRRLLRDLSTGQIYYDPMEPVEPLPEASVEQPSADPAPPIKPSPLPSERRYSNGA